MKVYATSESTADIYIFITFLAEVCNESERYAYSSAFEYAVELRKLLPLLPTGRYLPLQRTTHICMVMIPLFQSASCMIIPNDINLTIQCHLISHASPLISSTPVGVCCGLGIPQHRLIPGFFSNAP